jgi:hypothetical protein
MVSAREDVCRMDAASRCYNRTSDPVQDNQALIAILCATTWYDEDRGRQLGLLDLPFPA